MDEVEETLKQCEIEQPEPCEDAVSRQAAVNEIAEWMLNYGGKNEKPERDALQHAARSIKKLPSITPKSKTGKWLMDGEECGELMWRCSECKVSEAVPTATSFATMKRYPQWHYCPNCGAAMMEDK